MATNSDTVAVKYFISEYRLRMPNEAFFFIKIHNFWSWVNSHFFFVKTKPLYPNLGLGFAFEFGPQSIWNLAIVYPYVVRVLGHLNFHQFG